jgi:short-subunit dehydrogenase
MPKIIYIILVFILAQIMFDITSPWFTRNHYNPAQTKVIIIGATSGIGQATAKEFARRGYTVGITGRRTQRLQLIKDEIGDNLYIQSMDIGKPEEAQQQLRDLINQMGGVDVIILNAGTGTMGLNWQQQKKIIDVNVLGFVAMASAATEYFLAQGKGHIVGVSSIAGLRGISSSPAYSASKAFVSNYLDGLRARFKKMNASIIVTEIQPGLVGSKIPDPDSDWSVVDPALSKITNLLRAMPEKAAVQICDAIEAQRDHAYITKRWRFIAWIFKVLPDFLFNRIA